MPGRPLLLAQLDAMHQSRGGDWYYRTHAPGQALSQLDGMYVVNLDQGHRRLQPVLEQADVLVINGVCSADLLPVIQQRKQQQRLTVFEINDDVESIQASNPLAAFFGQPENVRLYRRLARVCDAVQYSSPELERLYAPLNPRRRVLPNHLSRIPPLRAADTGPGVRLGWGGSSGHLEDMELVAPALCWFVQTHPDVTLHLMCSDRIWRLFDVLPEERKRRTPVGSIEEYYAFVGQLDIGIAPNRDEGFNRSRSDVKFLEYAGYGAVPVVQRLAPYLHTVAHGETGFLFDSTEELLALLERLVADPSERQRIRVQAHRYVSEQRLQSAHAAERAAFYDELSQRAGSESAPRLFEELTALEGAEASGRHLLLGHGRFESALHDGLVALQQGGLEARGVQLLRTAASMEPTHPLPELFLGVHTQSEPALLAALRKNPRSVEALLALGSVALSKQQFRPALERFLTAAELAPGYEMPFLYAAQAVAQLGATKEAAEFERLAQTLAEPVLPPPRAPRAATTAVTQTPAMVPAPMPAPTTSIPIERPAWHLLERGAHLETLNPSYAPTGLLEMIEPAPRRVLDVGCFCGGTGRFLKARFPGCQVVGIEMLEKAAAMAAEVYDRVLVATLEQVDFAREGLEPGSFDAIVAADVLEHLFNPWQALQRLRPLLAPGGALYVSLPNMRNLKLLSELGRGRFDYAGAGILDVTHVRFFTRQTAVQMLEQTGFNVQDIRINPDARLAATYEGKDLNAITSIELDGLTLHGLAPQDLLELAALQLYLRATPS